MGLPWSFLGRVISKCYTLMSALICNKCNIFCRIMYLQSILYTIPIFFSFAMLVFATDIIFVWMIYMLKDKWFSYYHCPILDYWWIFVVYSNIWNKKICNLKSLRILNDIESLLLYIWYCSCNAWLNINYTINLLPIQHIKGVSTRPPKATIFAGIT